MLYFSFVADNSFVLEHVSLYITVIITMTSLKLTDIYCMLYVLGTNGKIT